MTGLILADLLLRYAAAGAATFLLLTYGDHATGRGVNLARAAHRAAIWPVTWAGALWVSFRSAKIGGGA